MTPIEFRKHQGWTQEQIAERLGVRSKGYISDLEGGTQPWPLKLALRLEKLSEGVVRAADICAEAAELLPRPPAEAWAS